ncbi:MAG: choline-sulfatase [Myxococcota bacterium]|jgi:choline-sulfatase
MFLSILYACAGETPAPAPAVPQPSLVVVTLDTTRADHIGAYGYAAAQTPNIDQLAAQGLRFERAYATVPLTIPAHSSIFTGLYPTRHGVHTNGDAVLPDEVETLAEHLRAAGYQTAASVSAFVTSQIWGLGQGFDVYYDDVRSATHSPAGRWAKERPAGETIDDAIGWLSARPAAEPAPFFLWVHLFDAHDPYEQHDGYEAEHPYDSELAYIDAELGRLREAVGVAGGAAWIIVGDHGEALEGEHGERSHGLFLFDPTVHVPFIVTPAQPLAAPQVAVGAVSIADVTPTALGMLGLPIPDGLDGVDLSPELSGAAVPRRPVYLESYTVQQRFGFHPELAMAEGEWKLMATPDARLYDLAADPGESHSRLAEHPDEVAALRAALAAVEAKAVEADRLAVSPELASRLAALGYTTGEHATGEERSGTDAKQQHALLSALEEARGMGVKGAAPAELEAAYREILASHPELSEARTGLAQALQRQGRHAEALALYDEALRVDVSSAVVQTNRANLLAAMDRKEEALQAMEAVLVLVPRDDVARAGVLKLMTDLGREDEAEQQARTWMELDPDEPALQAHLGILLARRGALAEARPLLEASLSDRVPRQYVHRMLAQAALAFNEPRVALGHFRTETEIFPGNVEARMSLGNVLMRLELWEEAGAEFRALLDRTPEHTEARRGLAQSIFNTGDYVVAAEALAPALAATPDDPLVLLLHANILAKQGRRAEAEAAFTRAQALREATP